MIQCSGKGPIRRKTNKNKSNVTVIAMPLLVLFAFQHFQSLFSQSPTEDWYIYYSVCTAPSTMGSSYCVYSSRITIKIR